MPTTSERINAPELLDFPLGYYSPEELEGSLADIATINRYLGDNRAVLKHLAGMTSGSAQKGFTALDIGTGSGDIPLAIAGWARKAGIDMELTAIDSNPQTIDIARRHIGNTPGINLMVGDGLELPFPDKHFDFVLCCKTLHHLTVEQAVRMVGEAVRVARRGYLILDLRRSRIAYALIYVLTRLFTRNRLTRNDGPLSVLRAFTPQEFSLIASVAGASNFTLHREPFWLMVLAGGIG